MNFQWNLLYLTLNNGQMVSLKVPVSLSSSLLVPNIWSVRKNWHSNGRLAEEREKQKGNKAAAPIRTAAANSNWNWKSRERGLVFDRLEHFYCGPLFFKVIHSAFFHFNSTFEASSNLLLAPKLNLSNIIWNTSSLSPSRMRWKVARAWWVEDSIALIHFHSIYDVVFGCIDSNLMSFCFSECLVFLVLCAFTTPTIVPQLALLWWANWCSRFAFECLEALSVYY